MEISAALWASWLGKERLFTGSFLLCQIVTIILPFLHSVLAIGMKAWFVPQVIMMIRTNMILLYIHSCMYKYIFLHFFNGHLLEMSCQHCNCVLLCVLTNTFIYFFIHSFIHSFVWVETREEWFAAQAAVYWYCWWLCVDSRSGAEAVLL